MQNKTDALNLSDIVQIDYQKQIAIELATETEIIKRAVEHNVELQRTLIDQITIIDQENLDTIEAHLIKSDVHLESANDNLEVIDKNTVSYINPFKNLSNIFNLTKSMFYIFSKKN
jgi:hypothetical protein